MAFNVASVAVRLLSNAKQFARDMKQAKQEVGLFSRGAQASLAAAATAAAGFSFTKQIDLIKFNDELKHLSVQLNTSVEDLQELAYVSANIGVNFKTFSTGLQRVTRRAGEATAEGEKLRAAFAEIGIDSDKFLSLGMTDRVALLAEKFKMAKKDGGELATIFKLLDTEGVSLNRLADGGGEMVLALASTARELGLVNAKLAEADQRTVGWATKVGAFFTGKLNKWRAIWQAPQTAVSTFANSTGTLMERVGKAVLATRAQMNGFKQSISEADQALRRQNVLQAGTIDAAKRAALLARKAKGTLGKQINLATTFTGKSAAGFTQAKPQEVKSKRLDSIDDTLRKILGGMRNNTTGASVFFTG